MFYSEYQSVLFPSWWIKVIQQLTLNTDFQDVLTRDWEIQPGSQLRWAAIGKRREHAASFSEKKDVKESKVESDKVQRAMSQAFVYGKMQRAFQVSNIQVIQKFQMPIGVKCMPTYHESWLHNTQWSITALI